MFATQLDVAQPQASSDLDLEAFRGLLATQAQEIWREHVPGGHHALTGLRVPHLASYVPNAVQLLLRLPAVAMWLAKHAEHCEMGSTEEGRSERCVTCALWASRRNFNERAGRGERKSFVPLFVRRGLVGKVFASGGEQDVCAFFRDLLAEMRRVEINSSRAVVWPGMTGAAGDLCTHVDRLFTHVCEERCRCAGCGAVAVKFTRAGVLSLPVPELPSSSAVACVTDMYTEYCRKKKVGSGEDGLLLCQCTCGSRQEHWVQRRMASSPNLLLVEVPRFIEQGGFRTFALEAEEELFLPDLAPLELFGAVYFKGRKFGEQGSGYTCVCRGPDDQFWEFNGEADPRRPMQNIANDKRRSSCLLVYTRRRGSSVFVGSGERAGGGGAQEASKKEADSVKAAVRAVARTVTTRVETKDEAQPTSGVSSTGATVGDVPSAEWAQVVAKTVWKTCLSCKKIWNGPDEVPEVPKDLWKKGLILVTFTCDDCTVVREATAPESEAKKRRLAKEGEVGEEVELEEPRQRCERDEAKPSDMVPDDAEGSATDRQGQLAAAGADEASVPVGDARLKRLRPIRQETPDAEGSRAQDALAVPTVSSGDVIADERALKRQVVAQSAEERKVVTIEDAMKRGKLERRRAEAARKRKADEDQAAKEAAKKRAVELQRERAEAERKRKAAEQEAAEKAAAEAVQKAEQEAAAKRAAEEEAARKRAEEQQREQAEIERKRKAAEQEATAKAAATKRAAEEAEKSRRRAAEEAAAMTSGSAASSSGGGAEEVRYVSAECPPAEGARPAWSLPCFWTFASAQPPEIADASLLSLPVDRFCERLVGMSQEEFVRDVWLCGSGVACGIQNLGGTSCFVNSFMQVLVRLEPFVRLLRTHRHQSDICVLCKIRDQIEDMRQMQVIERSSVTLAARAGNFRGGQDFVGDAVTGEGGQCDVWEFCTAAVEEIEAWERDRKTSCFRGEDETTLERVKTRPILQEFVWGALVRTRNRCAKCAGSSDSVMHRQFLDLNLVDGYDTLQGLYERWATEFRGADTVCPLRCPGGRAYTQYFLEREPPVLFFRLLRFRPAEDYGSTFRINRDIRIPEKFTILRSGPYQIAAVVMHHGNSTLCWEGSRGDEDRYRWYSDAQVSTDMTWSQVQRTRFWDNRTTVGLGAYIVCYVRAGFWGDAVGDGSECVPYQRDSHTVDVAKSMFRGRPT